MEINRHGDFILIGKNISSQMIQDLIKRMDISLRINPILPQFEGVASGTGTVRLGGSLLVGTIKPNSPVLQTHFKDLMSKLSAIPGSGNQTFTGFYLRAHGQTPIFGASCLLQVTVWAEGRRSALRSMCRSIRPLT